MRTLLFVFVLSFFFSVAHAHVDLAWCAGTPSFRDSSTHAEWTGHILNYQICSHQSRSAAYLVTGRIRMGAIDHYWPLCASRLECVRESATLRSDGLYCLTGTTEFTFSAPPHRSVFDKTDPEPAEVMFYDNHERNVLRLCD